MSLRDQFRESSDSRVFIYWDTEFTIEDIIYISLLKSRNVVLGSKFYTTFRGKDDYTTSNYIVNTKANEEYLDQKLLLLVVICASDRSCVYTKNDQNVPVPYKAQPEFLQKCWELAMTHKVEHKRFGTAVKAIGYEVHQDCPDFEYWYLNGAGGKTKAV